MEWQIDILELSKYCRVIATAQLELKFKLANSLSPEGVLFQGGSMFQVSTGATATFVRFEGLKYRRDVEIMGGDERLKIAKVRLETDRDMYKLSKMRFSSQYLV